jgi:hypothetical protein
MVTNTLGGMNRLSVDPMFVLRRGGPVGVGRRHPDLVDRTSLRQLHGSATNVFRRRIFVDLQLRLLTASKIAKGHGPQLLKFQELVE